MSAEKCFCHLNGYKVKDADARESIENIEGDLLEYDDRLTDLEGYQMDHAGRLTTIENELSDHSIRLTTIENDHVIGNKLYQHYIKATLGDTSNYDILFYFIHYNKNPEPITVLTDAIIHSIMCNCNMPPYENEGVKYPVTNFTYAGNRLTMHYFTDVAAGVTAIKTYTTSKINLITDTVTEV